MTDPQQEDMRGISFQSIPFKFDVSKARTDGYSDDEILKHLGESKQFDTQRALKDGYSKQELINHLTGFSPELDPSHGRDTTDHVINFLRPLLSSAGAAVAAPTSALTGGIPVGPVAAYTGIDALLQHLQSKPPEGIVSQGAGMEPGGIASTLSNTAEQYGTGKLLDGLVSGVGRGIKAVRNADQPEIYNFEPTTSQAAKSYGYSKLAGISKAMEDLNTDAKNKALDRTAGTGFSQAMKTLRDMDLNYSRNPQSMLDIVRDDMPLGDGSRLPVKFTDLGRQTTPIKFSGNPREATPIKFNERPTSPSNPLGKPELVPGETKNLTPKEYSTIPGETKNLPGGEIQANYGQPKLNEITTLPELDSVIRDPNKLKATLARAQELGTGENLKKSLAGYQFIKIFNAATTRDISKNTSFMADNVVRINAATLSEEWLKPEMQESLKTLYNANQRADIEQFFKNLSYTQDKISAAPFTKKLWLMSGGAAIGHGLLSGNLTSAVGGAASIGTYISAQQLSKLLTNPKTARFMVALAGSEPLGVSETYAARAIAQVLNGSVVSMINPDGSKMPGKIEDGKFTPIR